MITVRGHEIPSAPAPLGLPETEIIVDELSLPMEDSHLVLLALKTWAGCNPRKADTTDEKIWASHGKFPTSRLGWPHNQDSTTRALFGYMYSAVILENIETAQWEGADLVVVRSKHVTEVAKSIAYGLAVLHTQNPRTTDHPSSLLALQIESM
jgi:hypothetical protein